MTELRVYINPAGTPDARTVFYSRRADGPYYRWQYEEGGELWCASRVRLSNPTLRALCVASWQSVPTTLQARLANHYLE
ncbi:MAG: hypothetical protein QOF61_463 [Acidobacteriota bacterium]|jgi:hypothetical protein|nr:hypothetical protein [Acidobacteriota bacterium]